MIKSWGRVDPRIRKLARALTAMGYRITSIVRPGAVSHATGRALDIAPMMYSDSFGSLKTAKRVYDVVRRIVGPDMMVVGEDDHIHISTMRPHGPGYQGRDGNVKPTKPA